jgi:hypothetical protein
VQVANSRMEGHWSGLDLAKEEQSRAGICLDSTTTATISYRRKEVDKKSC